MQKVLTGAMAIVKEYAGKMALNKIAELAMVSPSTASRYARLLNVSVEMPEKAERVRRANEAIMNNRDKTIAEVAELIGDSRQYVRTRCFALGIELKNSFQKKEHKHGKFFNEKHDGAWLVG